MPTLFLLKEARILAAMPLQETEIPGTLQALAITTPTSFQLSRNTHGSSQTIILVALKIV